MCDGVKKDCGGDGVDGGVLPRGNVSAGYNYTGELCSTARHRLARAQTDGRLAVSPRRGEGAVLTHASRRGCARRRSVVRALRYG